MKGYVIHKAIASWVMCGIVVLAITLGLLLAFYLPPSLRTAQPIDQPVLPIAHGLGGLPGRAVPNSADAFRYNYDRGYRWFEIDLRLTRDKRLVAYHDPRFMSGQGKAITINRMTYDELHDEKLLGSSLITFSDVLGLLEQYPDAYLVLDIKDSFVISYQIIQAELRNLVGRFGKDVADAIRARIVPQFYFKWHYTYLKKLFNVPLTIFTLYESEYTDEEVFNFVTDHSVSMVTMSTERYSPSLAHALADFYVASGVHTVNDVEVARQFIVDGAVGVYTDFLTPQDLLLLK